MKHNWEPKKKNGECYFECRRCGQTVSQFIPRTGAQLIQALNAECLLSWEEAEKKFPTWEEFDREFVIPAMIAAFSKGFIGYCFAIGDRHTEPVELHDAREVYNYLKKNMAVYPRVIATDLGDNIVAEAINNQFVFPEEWMEFNRHPEIEEVLL